MDAHLTAEQFDELLLRALRRRSITPDEAWLGNVQAHVDICSMCRSRVQEQLDVAQALGELKIAIPEPSKPSCPGDSVWLDLAAGIMSSNSSSYVEHAIACKHCGPLLKEALSDFSDEITPEEEAFIRNLPSSRSRWQSRMANAIRAHQPRRVLPLRNVLRLVTAGSLATGALIVAALISIHEWRPSADQLLAKAYSDDRTIELRIPGAGAAPLRIRRGGEESLISRNPILLKADSLIADSLRKHPDDPYWLQMKGRAELLTWDYDSAIASLSKASDLGNTSTAARIDLATAYYERADATQTPSDYGSALQILSGVLASTPNDETALFNKALVLEKLMLYSQSREAWKQYLALFPKGPWASEANEHEQALQHRIDSHTSNEGESSLDADSFLAAVSQGAMSDAVSARIEEYQEAALREWLPKYFGLPSSRSSGRVSASMRRALDLLASLELGAHHDRFMYDLVTAENYEAFRRGATELSFAIRDNRSGQNTAALREARRSETAFATGGIVSGQLRARFEEAYAAQRLFDASSCVDAANAVEKESRVHEFRWLQAQAIIEEAFCHNEEGLVGRAALESRRAAELARKFQYQDTFLRASVGAAAAEWEAGSTTKAWALVADGLREYWNRNASGHRAEAFYTILDAIAEYNQEGYLQSSVIKEYLRLLNADQDPAEAVMTWYRLGNCELSIGNVDDAATAFREVGTILNRSTPDRAIQDRWILGAVGLAKVDLRRGELEHASHTLSSISSAISTVQESLGTMDYFATLGRVEVALGHKAAARDAYGSAIDISERGLSTLDSPRDRMAWVRTFTPAYRGLVDLDFRSGDTVGSFALWEWYHAIPLRARLASQKLHPPMWVATPRSLDDVHADSSWAPLLRRTKRSDSTIDLVSYAELNHVFIAWVYTRKGLSAVSINANPTYIESLSRRLWRDCSDPSSDLSSVRQEGRQLYQLVLAPIEPLLGSDSRVLIEPDGILQQIPFEVLVEPDGRYFGESHSLIYSPGSAYIDSLHDRHPLSRHSKLVIVQGIRANTSQGMLPDPLAEREANGIRDLFPESALFQDPQMEDVTFRRRLAESEVFHYAGHTDDRGEQRGLLALVRVGGDRLGGIAAGDLYEAKFPHCQLAVLSGCSTSFDVDGRWISQNGLVLPFLAAGVPCVVASRWNVDSDQTARLMHAFYSRLLAGLDPASAMGAATHLMRASSSTSHPYYWASFNLFGSCQS